MSQFIFLEDNGTLHSIDYSVTPLEFYSVAEKRYPNDNRNADSEPTGKYKVIVGFRSSFYTLRVVENIELANALVSDLAWTTARHEEGDIVVLCKSGRVSSLSKRHPEYRSNYILELIGK